MIGAATLFIQVAAYPPAYAVGGGGDQLGTAPPRRVAAARVTQWPHQQVGGQALAQRGQGQVRAGVAGDLGQVVVAADVGVDVDQWGDVTEGLAQLLLGPERAVQTLRQQRADALLVGIEAHQAPARAALRVYQQRLLVDG